MKKLLFVLLVPVLWLAGCSSEKVQPLPTGCPTTIYFSTDVKPIFDAKCISCHLAGSVDPPDFTDLSVIQANAQDIKRRVFDLHDMPQAGSTPLTQDEMDKLRCWLDQGAMNN